MNRPSATHRKSRGKQYVRLPLKVLRFLLGISPLEGVWFGNEHPLKYGRFWWRSTYLSKHYKRVNAARGK